jgi:DNA-binding Xre family transcriptional regulator
MLYFNFNPIFEARQIAKPYTFLVKIGIAPHTAQKILRNDTHVIRLDNLELICKALYCNPNDVMAYKPDNDNPIPDNHPLKKLIPIQNEDQWQQQLKTMPLNKLREMGKLLNEINNSDQ